MRRAIVAATILLAACSTPSSRFADNLPTYWRTCQDAGMKPGNADFEQCMAMLANADEQARAAQKDRALMLGTFLMQQSQPHPVSAPTVCRWIGPNWVCQ